MLTFYVSFDGTARRWAERGPSWVAGPCTVTPWCHPAVTSSLTSSDDGDVFTVREKRSGGDHITLVLQPTGQVLIEAGHGGVAPVYVVVDRGQLVGSWDPADLAGICGGDLTPEVVARLLTRRHRYSSATAFASMTRVTAGSTVTWSPSTGVTNSYPLPAQHVVRPRSLRDGADPVEAFSRLLDEIVAESAASASGLVGVELSGGLDSANVAVSAHATADSEVVSGGLLVHGAGRRSQRRRRRCIAERLDLTDRTVEARDHLPLTPDGSRTADRPHYPDGDVYQEAFDMLRRDLRNRGVRTVLTGYGGDETMSLAPHERSAPPVAQALPDWLTDRTRDALTGVDDGCSPVTAVPLPTLVVFAARHPHYLRAGLWPVAPYADPRLGRFARSLPVEWRTDKLLLRRRLARVGLPREVTHPRRPESFASTMRLALRRHAARLLGEMLDRSPLLDGQFVHRDGVERLWRSARWGRALPPMVFDMLALDIGIRSMMVARGAPCGR